MAANGFVSIAPHHQKLTVGSSCRRVRIIYVFIREALREPQIDIRNQSFFIPRLGDLFGRKRNQRRTLFLRYLERVGDGVSLVLRVGIGEQKPRAFCLLDSSPNGIILANPSIGQGA